MASANTQQQQDEENNNYDNDDILMQTDTDIDLDLTERSREIAGREVETTFLTRADDQENDDDVCAPTGIRSVSGRKNDVRKNTMNKNVRIDDQSNSTRRTSNLDRDRDRERDREKEKEKERDKERDAAADRVMARVLRNDGPRSISRPASHHTVPSNHTRVSSARTSRDAQGRDGGSSVRGQLDEGGQRIGGGGRGNDISYSNSNSNYTTSDLTAYRCGESYNGPLHYIDAEFTLFLLYLFFLRCTLMP